MAEITTRVARISLETAAGAVERSNVVSLIAYALFAGLPLYPARRGRQHWSTTSVTSRWAVVAAALLALSAGASHGQQRARPGPTLAGIVTDTARTPLVAAEVGLIVDREIVRTVRTDTGGRFELADVPRGKASVLVRRLGYQPRVYTIRIREGAPRGFIPIVLDAMPAELEKVIILARVTASNGRLAGFYERKSRGGWGSFIDREEIEARHPAWMSDMLRSVPGVRVIPTRMGNVVRFRGCAPTVWLDGMPLRNTELDAVVLPNDVAGVEVYRSSAGLPAQFTSMSNCGAIVVWMRAR